MRSIPFQVAVDEERIIRADFFPCQEKSRGLLVICHGFKGFKDWGFFPHVAQELSALVDVITFNFTNNGVGEDLTTFSELDRFAKNTYSSELEDLHTLIQRIKEQKIEALPHRLSTAPLFLLGHSRGGGVSLIYALDHSTEIKAVMSWNGITNVDLFSTELKEEMRLKGRAYLPNARTKQQMPLDKIILDDMEQHHERFNIIERISEATFPIILIQGTNDSPHLREGSAKIVDKNPAIEWIQIPDGNHTFGAVHPYQGMTKPLQEALTQTKEYLSRF